MMQVRYFCILLFVDYSSPPRHWILSAAPGTSATPFGPQNPGLPLTSFGYVVGVVFADSCRER